MSQPKQQTGFLADAVHTGTPRNTVREAARMLEESGVPEPLASAEILMSELVGRPRGELSLIPEPLCGDKAALYESWVLRRRLREPVQRILGHAYFRNLTLELGAEALIPRPDTESVVDAALEAVDRLGGGCRVLDLGTGSGAIAVSIADERPACEVHASDLSGETLRVARKNAARAGRCTRFHHADLAAGLDSLAGGVDVLVSNPPYVPTAELDRLEPEVRDWDPHTALDGGGDGLDLYRRIFAESSPLLAPDARLVLEVGDGQAEAVQSLGRDAGYEPLGTRTDLTRAVRAVLLGRP
ncbi:peptide chain release factor N(5)-glutamine methyltransferase [Rubrobacter aplysinae]|uniref:peptide chain release factor N(5)-glutamine methyltransferase n=1 Tax=Rubrobacter aplysinae TaxID=909625 RepID=UPI00069FEAC2|nr:peptide chain release factor N(5)-glutamine methyltransferase [Rubrobacter aplysinae]